MAPVRSALVCLASAGCLSLGEPPLPECGAPRMIAELVDLATQSDDTSPWLSPDRLEILFSSDRDGSGLRLFNASRESIREPFDPPVQLAGLELAGITRDPFLEPDGRTLWFTYHPAAQQPQIYRATRAQSPSSRFSAAQATELGEGEHPSMTADGLTLYFSRTSGGVLSIWRASRSTTSLSFTDVVEVTSVRGSDLALGLHAPTISPAGDRLLFSYSPTGTRPFLIFESDILGGVFEPGTPEQDTQPTDLGDSDEGPAFHAAGETFVFASDRDLANSGLDLFVACE